jgi:hypothetical protein
MPDAPQAAAQRPYSGPGPGSTVAPCANITITTERTLDQWRERITDQHVCWLVVRLIHCKFAWLTVDSKWDKRQRMAAAWSEREDAYQAARQVNGLLYCYDRG